MRIQPVLFTVADNAIIDTTSNPIDISGAKKISIFLNEANESEIITINNRQVDLTVQVSLDGTNFYAYNMIINDTTTTNTETLTRIATKNRATAGTDVLVMSDNFAFTHMKVLLNVTDGADPAGFINCKVLVEFN